MTWSELRVVPSTPVLGPVVVGTLLLAATSAGMLGGPGPPLLWLGLASLAAGTAFVLDEPAAAVVAATPRTRRSRTAQRLAVTAVVLTGWIVFAAVVAAADDREPAVSPTALVVVGTGLILVTAACTDLMRRMGLDEPGAAVGTTVVAVVLGGMIFQPLLPGGLVPLDAYASPARMEAFWGVLASCALVSLWWSSADQGARRRRTRGVVSRAELPPRRPPAGQPAHPG